MENVRGSLSLSQCDVQLTSPPIAAQWGLITGRTSVYLFDPKKSGIASRKRVIGVQSHEVAHQW